MSNTSKFYFNDTNLLNITSFDYNDPNVTSYYEKNLNVTESTLITDSYNELSSPSTVGITAADAEKLAKKLPSSERMRLRRLCWETMFGQEFIKLNVMDLVRTKNSCITILKTRYCYYY